MQLGFFDDSLFNEVIAHKKGKKQMDCFTCGLFRTCKTPKMKPTGEGKKKILIIAEAPGRQEDEKGMHLIGDAGQFLRESLEKLGYDLNVDFWKTNAIICRPLNNAKPTNEQVECCKVNVINAIEKYKPVGILLLGETAFKSLLGVKVQKHLSKHQFKDFVGQCIPDQAFKMWIGVMYHPSYVIRSEENSKDYKTGRVKDTSVRLLWERNLKKVLDIMQKPFYVNNYQSEVFTTQNKQQAISWINNAIDKAEIIGIDYESTGLKPHRKGHEIKCMSFSDGMFAYSFPNFKDEEFQEVWKMLLKGDKEIRAHNIRFEGMWTQTTLKYNMVGKLYDTMLAAHCFSNRMRTGLKFWVYVLFGMLGYDSEIERYIKSKRKGENEKSSNSFNEIEKADLDELLLYNGLDSLLCYKLGDYFEKELRGFQKKGLGLLIEGGTYLLDAQQKGIRINTELLQQTKKEIEGKLKQLDAEIMQSKEVANKWDSVKKFSYTSNKDLPKLLFDILKIPKPTKKEELTKKGQPSLDKKNLPRYEKKYPFIKLILRWKKWQRTLACIDQFEREVVDDLVHPNFNLNTARTFRPSTSDPNFANIAKRDEETKTIMRSLVVPREECCLIEYDFKQLEVCINACINKDPVLLEYVRQEKSHLHTDQAVILFMKEKKDIDKIEAFVCKNSFVFATFYGSYYKQTAPDLWKNMPDVTKQHLRECGIQNYFDFEEHVKIVERALWEKFHVYAEWQKSIYREYLKNGYIDTLTGFRLQGWMKKNDVICYPAQGCAFHCLLQLIIWISKELKKRKIKRSFLINQVYDSTFWNMHPDDEKEIDFMYYDFVTNILPKIYDWLIVPLKIEKERSSIGGSWAEMENMGVLSCQK
jgi:DNA polymerase